MKSNVILLHASTTHTDHRHRDHLTKAETPKQDRRIPADEEEESPDEWDDWDDNLDDE